MKENVSVCFFLNTVYKQMRDLAHTIKSKQSEVNPVSYEAKSSRPNLWAAQIIVQLQNATQYYYKLDSSSSDIPYYSRSNSEVNSGQEEFKGHTKCWLTHLVSICYSQWCLVEQTSTEKSCLTQFSAEPRSLQVKKMHNSCRSDLQKEHQHGKIYHTQT